MLIITILIILYYLLIFLQDIFAIYFEIYAYAFHLTLFLSSLNIFGFWAVGQTKQATWRRHLGLYGVVMAIFHYLLTFYGLNDNQLIKNS